MPIYPAKTENCPLCQSTAEVSLYARSIRVGRRSFRVQGLQKWACGSCNFEFTDETQSVHNLGLIESVTRSQQGAVTRGLMRQLRKTWGLTQAMASKLFGAGDSSFAKWESGQTNISQPSALLVQTAAHVPGVMAFLADLAKIELHPMEAVRWGATLQQARQPTAYQNWTTSVEVETLQAARVSLWCASQSHQTFPANDAYMEIARQARLSDWGPHLNHLTNDKAAA